MSINGAQKINVAVLGPIGTYSHEAAYSKFGVNAEYVELPTITDVLSSLSDKVPFAVVPQENSIFGIVIETYDALRNRTIGYIRGEVTLKVDHCLLVRRGVKLEEITKIMSHEQALGQCHDFIASNLPNATLVKMPSTASAARALSDSPRNCAAICSKICATLFEDLEVLRVGIQRDKANFTRFYILAQDENTHLPDFLEGQPERKALLQLQLLISPTTHKSLLDLLNLLELNIGRIDRRPSMVATPFQDIYFVELHGDRPDSIPAHCPDWKLRVQQSLERLKRAGGNANLLGIW
ncbi:Prephenate dehydratase-domain-containing protein [Cyathus striatus]|nr:Prephenate dehydratase-domain-containing protein [Cyathus striatus]